MDYRFEDLKYLAIQLPEDILKEKWSGNFDAARKIINNRMENVNLPYPLRSRLYQELEILDTLESCYTTSKEDALAQVREKIPAFTEEEFDKLEIEGRIDWIYLNGEKRYLDSFCATLFKVYPDLWARTDQGDSSDYSLLDNLVSDLKDGDELSAYIHIKQTLSLKDNGDKLLRVHIPIPQENEYIKDLAIIDIYPQPQKMPGKEEVQSTIYFESDSREYFVEYELVHKRTYRNLSEVDLEKVENSQIPEELNVYLEEKHPHITFSPYLRTLTADIVGEETNLLAKARLIYDYITTHIDYRFVREYSTIENIPEYCAINQKGDCGVQGLLFITLCRIAGIPAKWESGLDAKIGDVGEHDWAMFYIPSLGWLYADLSYGASSYIRGAYDRWNFFFGNVDPYRIPINDDYQCELVPPKKFRRIDPYDNQCGEAESDSFGFGCTDVEYSYEDKGIK